MLFWAQLWRVASTEFQSFVRFPRLILAALVVIAIPALYGVIYLSSVWDPAARTGALAVGLVNLDQGIRYKDGQFNVGREVMDTLLAQQRFGYQTLADPELARQRVRQGQLAFALIIPPDFSSNALPGAQPGGGKLVVYTSEGNNYESASIAKRFAEELGHQVNESLNERRWALVLLSAAGSQRSVDRLRDGVAQLRSGAADIDQGTQKLANGSRSVSAGARTLDDGVAQFTNGFRQLSAGIKTMDNKRPNNNDLHRLKSGAETLAAGHTELDKGLDQLVDGSGRLQSGLNKLRDETRDSLLVSSRLTDAAAQLADGMGQLGGGVQTAASNHQKLTDGATQLSGAVGTLVNGVRTLGNGIHTAASQLPEDSQLDALAAGASALSRGTAAVADGARKLRNGTQTLASGLDLLASSLPNPVDSPDGSAQGLSTSVQPVLEIHAAVENNGSGFAANVIPGALWLGAGIAAFLIHVSTLPRMAQRYIAPAKALGKLAVPSLIVLLQAGLIGLVLHFYLHVRIANPAGFAVTLVVSALAFLCIVFALTRAFGDAGKALAMVLLALQLSSSGGVLPIELSGGMFAQISPWLPMTWVVQAFKATLFGAYDGVWLPPLQWVASVGLIALAVSCWVGRWRYVKGKTLPVSINF